MDLYISVASRADPVPAPKLSLPGFAFAYATSSRTFFTGSDGFTSSTNGVVPAHDR